MRRAVLRIFAGFLASAFLFAGTAFAERVLRVADGDTIVVRGEDGKNMRVRLWGIDDPERDQPFGDAARDRLRTLVEGKDVRLDVRDRDAYGRAVAVVFLGDEDVCLRQIEEGFAWHYRRYAPHARAYAEAEKRARAERRGLWADADPVPPWEWRRRERRKR